MIWLEASRLTRPIADGAADRDEEPEVKRTVIEPKLMPESTPMAVGAEGGSEAAESEAGGEEPGGGDGSSKT